MFLIWTLASAILASSERPMIRGPTRAAKRARITTTTMISMRVKPRLLCNVRFIYASGDTLTCRGDSLWSPGLYVLEEGRHGDLPLLDQLIQLEYRKQHRHHHRSYRNAHSQHEQRFQKGHGPADGGVELFFKGGARLQQHILQLPALLPHRDHVHH